MVIPTSWSPSLPDPEQPEQPNMESPSVDRIIVIPDSEWQRLISMSEGPPPNVLSINANGSSDLLLESIFDQLRNGPNVPFGGPNAPTFSEPNEIQSPPPVHRPPGFV